jgi:hypothetical protein
VIAFFKQKSSSNVVTLLLYALVLKFPLFLHPQLPMLQPEDHYLYKALVSFLTYGLGFGPFIFTLLAFGLLLGQSLLFNMVCGLQKMYSRSNFLPAMSFLLITSLMPGWNVFSAPLLVNSLLLWVFYNMLLLYDKGNPIGVIYNIGLMMGLISLMYKPALLLMPLLWMALSIMRPFYIREWMVGLLGLATPYYFLSIFLYLTDRWSWSKFLPSIHFSMPSQPPSALLSISIFLIVTGFLSGAYHIQNNLGKMLIQARKDWSLLLWMLLLSSLLIFTSNSMAYSAWVLCGLPLAAFHAAGYLYSSNRYLPSLLHWATFGFAIYLNYWVH